MSKVNKLRSAIQVVVGGHLVAGGFAIYQGNETMYKNCVMPVFRLFDAETAHWLAVKAAKYGLVPEDKGEYPRLKTRVWAQEFPNPVGVAAGFDKHGEAVDGLLKMGFGFVEVGSVTPEPQPGNPKPRVFRLSEDKAVINRYGFNSDGHEEVYQRLKARCDDGKGAGVLGINLGKNKTSEDAVSDYVTGVKKFGALSDYLVINISSPNTPGLRAMQGKKILQELLDKVIEARDSLQTEKKPPLLVKIAPDLTEQDKIDIAAVVTRQKGGVDGLIVSNTTITRPDSIKSKHKQEVGGLSGQPVKDLSTKVIKDMFILTQGRIPIIGVGGVNNGQDAYDKILSGASLVQVYTAFSYDGPPLIPKLKTELSELLEKDGYSSISEAVGAGITKTPQNT